MTDKIKRYPLLVEIGCENLPPLDQTLIQQSGEELFSKILSEKRIEYSKIKIFTSPRRITLKGSGVQARQQDLMEKIKGPPLDVAFKDGKAAPAGLGFARKMGVSFKDLIIEETPRGKYCFFRKKVKGRPLREMLDEVVKDFLKRLRVKERMRWPGGEISFARPIRWLVVKLGERAVRFKFGNIRASYSSRGHYMFAPRKIKIKEISRYEDLLERNYVVADHRKRKKMLLRSLNRPLEHTMGRLVENKELLEEINNSLEHPCGVMGRFPEKYLELPRLVIEACLVYHQKYFPVEDSEGNILNSFVVARDGISSDLAGIREGYQRVLVARLEDADFFIKKDRLKPLQDYLPALKGIEFTRGLGSLYNKVMRVRKLSEIISDRLNYPAAARQKVKRLAFLSKADLATHIVGEFPELEGSAGSIYARMDSENPDVCMGIEEHYMPKGPGDPIPSLDEAAVVGVADRLDTVAGNIGKGVRASGSQDPFGIRRACRGMLKIFTGKGWHMDLGLLTDESVKIYNREKKLIPSSAGQEIKDFLKSMISQILEEKFPHDTARCVLSWRELNPGESLKKAEAIEKIRKGPGFDRLVESFKRINNILRQAGEKEIDVPDKYDGRKLRHRDEKRVSRLLRDGEKEVERGIKEKDYDKVLTILISLKKPIDSFFDNVLVMDPREEVMKNRLALLKNILDLFSPLGDISKLELKDTCG